MGFAVVMFPRRTLVAIVVGLALAALPALVVHFGLRAYLDRLGNDRVEQTARTAVARADWRIDQAINTLSYLWSTEVTSCVDINLQTLRRAVMMTTPIKELSVIGQNGSTSCDHLGLAGQSWLVSRELTTQNPYVVIAVVRMADRADRALRVRWQRPNDPLSLAAFVPADMFLPDVTREDDKDKRDVHVQLADGTLLSATRAVLTPPEEQLEHTTAPDDRFIARITSARYPVTVIASTSRAEFMAEHGDLLTIGAVGSGAFGLLIFALVVIAPWRARSDPFAQLRAGLELRQFVPYYQPIVDITKGRLVGAEVLVRWQKPDGSLVQPGSFIPLAESTGLIVPMTRSIMQRVRAELGEAMAKRPNFEIGFNLTALHFADEAVVKDIADIFGDSPIRMSQIVVEVTERQPLGNLTSARRVIAALQELGVRVAIDDVGTGHGGLSYMLKLGVDVIKIDKMFVDAIGTERYSTTIIETLVELARNMRMGIVAEGVENFEQVAYLRERGIHHAQGYVFAPPLPGSSFLRLLEAIDPGSAAASSPGPAAMSVDGHLRPTRATNVAA